MDVTETKIQVQWNFISEGRSKRAADESYSVGVQIKYKKESDKEYLTYPEDGNKLPADQVMVYKTICGHLLNFENMIEISETVDFLACH